MSRFEARLVQASLVYLVLTGLLGVAAFVAPTWAPYFRTTHVHLGVVGFFLSMVMGVAYWLMPRPRGVRQEGAEARTFWLLQAGLVLRVGAEPWWRYTGATLPHVLSIASGVLLLGAILTFANAMRVRVKTKEAIWSARGATRRRD